MACGTVHSLRITQSSMVTNSSNETNPNKEYRRLCIVKHELPRHTMQRVKSFPSCIPNYDKVMHIRTVLSGTTALDHIAWALGTPRQRTHRVTLYRFREEFRG